MKNYNTTSMTVNTILYNCDKFSWCFVCLALCLDKPSVQVSLCSMSSKLGVIFS